MKFKKLNRADWQQWLVRVFPSNKPSTPSQNVSPARSPQLTEIGQSDVETVLYWLKTSTEGLSELHSQIRREEFGFNQIAHEKSLTWYIQLLKTFQNPLAILLIALALISLLTGDRKAATIILVMVVFSVILRFSQEFRSSQAAEKLRAMVRTTATVSRRDPRKDIPLDELREYGITLHPHEAEREEIPIEFLVPGDVIFLLG